MCRWLALLLSSVLRMFFCLIFGMCSWQCTVPMVWIVFSRDSWGVITHTHYIGLTPGFFYSGFKNSHRFAHLRQFQVALVTTCSATATRLMDLSMRHVGIHYFFGNKWWLKLATIGNDFQVVPSSFQFFWNMFTLTWGGNDPIWLIFFKWVETTN